MLLPDCVSMDVLFDPICSTYADVRMPIWLIVELLRSSRWITYASFDSPDWVSEELWLLPLCDTLAKPAPKYWPLMTSPNPPVADDWLTVEVWLVPACATLA